MPANSILRLIHPQRCQDTTILTPVRVAERHPGISMSFNVGERKNVCQLPLSGGDRHLILTRPNKQILIPVQFSSDVNFHHGSFHA
jgi:hypothetical protein